MASLLRVFRQEFEAGARQLAARAPHRALRPHVLALEGCEERPMHELIRTYRPG